MKRHNLYRPYIRRANGREVTTSLRIAIRLEFYRLLGKCPYYVLVQRGFPRVAVAVGPSRESIEQSILWLDIRRRYGSRFRDYAKSVQSISAGDTPLKEPTKRYDSGRYGKSLKGK